MVELLDLLVDILCQQGTASQCQSFINSYPDPAQQMVFFLFFPMVFLILFVHILGSGISQRTGNTKFTLLVSIAIFLFIIFQGWYHIFLNISRFWFIAVILLGGFWAVLHRMAPASGGGGNVSRGMKNAMGDFVRRKMLDIITKEEEDLRKKIEDRFKKLEGILDTIKKAPPGSEERAAAIMEFRRMCTDLEACIKELSDKGKIGDVKVLNYTRDYWDRYGKLTEKFRKMAE